MGMNDLERLVEMARRGHAFNPRNHHIIAQGYRAYADALLEPSRIPPDSLPEWAHQYYGQVSAFYTRAKDHYEQWMAQEKQVLSASKEEFRSFHSHVNRELRQLLALDYRYQSQVKQTIQKRKIRRPCDEARHQAP